MAQKTLALDESRTAIDNLVDYGIGYAKALWEKKKADAVDWLFDLIGLGDYYEEGMRGRESSRYKAFKGLVEKAIEGDDLGLDVYEVPFERLAARNAYGMWEGSAVKIPQLRDVPKILGSLYRRLFEDVREAGGAQTEDDFNADIQAYVDLHEKIEAVTRPKNHDLYEATLLYTLKELASKGSKAAGDIYKAAMATYKMRFESGDSFADGVQRYYKWLERDVDILFSNQPREVRADLRPALAPAA